MFLIEKERPKIIAIDFDNTITGNDKSFPDSSLSSIKPGAKYFIMIH
jgi:hydroxymethylpyrimidine pyrophosphatase-like HAD family hydrolase